MSFSHLAVTPPGALDLTGAAARLRRRLQRAAMDLLERAGYEELIPPTLEYQDTFLRAGGPGIAERLIRLKGLRPGRDVSVQYTGLRPGEKLREELYAADERLLPTDSEAVWRVEPT